MHIKVKSRSCHTTDIYLNISNAFDRIWQEGLLYKMYEQFWVHGNVFLLLINYFTNRKTSVKIGNHFFMNMMMVLQGSVLCPLLFLFFMDDLFQDINCMVSVYADDIFILSIIRKNQRLQIFDNRCKAFLS